MSYKIDKITGNVMLIDDPPNKLIYTDENVTIKTNTFLILIKPKLKGTSVLKIKGTGILKVS